MRGAETGPAAGGEPVAADQPEAHPRTLPPPRMVAAVAAGGAVGALIRAAGGAAFPTTAGAFPWATFVENITGAFLLAALLTVLAARGLVGGYARPLLGTGLGAYTTVSSFAVELSLLLRDGAPGVAGIYVGATVTVGLAAALLGIRAGCLPVVTRGRADGPHR